MKNPADDNAISEIPTLRNAQIKLKVQLLDTVEKIAKIEADIDRRLSSAYWQSGYTKEMVDELIGDIR